MKNLLKNSLVQIVLTTIALLSTFAAIFAFAYFTVGFGDMM